MTPTQICQFLEDFRILQSADMHSSERKLISLRVALPLLRAFRVKAERSGLRYQTQIQQLMKDWLQSG
jgi:predicted DNA binding CopG/RHH family protein